MVEYISEVFGKENVKLIDYKLNNFPSYMNSYKYEFVSLFDKKIVFMRPNRVRIDAYVSHSKMIENRLGYTPVLVLEKSKEGQRNNLIKNSVMFIEKDHYMFMPFLGVILSSDKSDELKNNIELSYNDYLISLVFLYSKKKELNVNDIMSIIPTNKMAVVRTMKKLEFFDVVRRNMNQKAYSYQLLLPKKEFFLFLLSMMKNPIKEKRIIKKENLPNSAVLSGISALANKTMLMDDSVATYAVRKEEYEIIKEKTEDYNEGFLMSNNEVILEVWYYDPRYYSDGRNAEDLSIIKILENEDDERVLGALEELKEKILNE